MRHATRSWSDTIKDEAAERFVVFCEFALTLKDVNLNLRLVIGSGREDFRFRSWNRSVTIDEWSTDTAHGFDTKGEWSNIEEKNILDVALKHTTLNSGTNSHDFVWVHTLHWVLAKDGFHLFDHGWHTSHTTDHDDFVDVFGGELGILKSLLNWASETVE